jgi:hypothetical protein
MIENNKSNNWNKFVESNSKDNPWGIVYSISKQKFKTGKISELRDTDGSIITDSKLIGKKLLDSLFPGDKDSNDTCYHKEIRHRAKSDYTGDTDLPFSQTEVTNRVEVQNSKKAPGLDGFTADIIKRFHTIDKSFLTILFNKCLLYGIFPDIWKISCVKIIKKPNKTDYTSPKAYRPISLIPVLGKILEKLLINRITFYLRNHQLLNEKQFGFAPQKSTIDAIDSAVKFIKKSFESKGFCVLIALDISGAFDNAFWPAILNNLRDYKCPENLYWLTESYFNNRFAKLWFNNKELTKSLSKGFPQGSACGPGFWGILYNTLLNLKLPDGIEIQGFTDDTLLMISSKTINELELKTNEALIQVFEWSLRNKFEFNALKITKVLFTKNIIYLKPKLILNSTELIISNSLNYLGVIIDSKLSWKMHVNNLKTKALQLIMNINSFAERKFGLNRRSLEIIYKGAIITILSYGIPVCIEALQKKYNKLIFERLQRLVAIRLCSAYKTVSTDALNIISNLMPLDLRLKQLATENHI